MAQTLACISCSPGCLTGIMHCKKDDWRSLENKQCSFVMSPYKQLFADVMFARGTAGFVSVYLNEGCFGYESKGQRKLSKNSEHLLSLSKKEEETWEVYYMMRQLLYTKEAIEGCFTGIMHCKKDDWRSLENKQCSFVMSPYEQLFADVMFARGTASFVSVYLNEATQGWRHVLLVTGIALLFSASKFSNREDVALDMRSKGQKDTPQNGDHLFSTEQKE
ncbi:hypothetical protein Tco_0992249 [Tanacetum coccineum]|uniref:Uncharacterized protein n=1 Tax=Tanacetum coccineum TaxID=301880 RepID=A0ABQ5F2W6_9ASTR